MLFELKKEISHMKIHMNTITRFEFNSLLLMLNKHLKKDTTFIY